ncbi:Kynurenine formamidase [Paenibacillus konkukensis]|uniref:Kynurenine formamidase n=1 Tax=Paenibacillus konkukensis TaxID=2020716 RepID=A0ABY4RLN0_9BACL|nr:cyclase family protein [Paenibacillus konkukensis]UQZ83412.1 Kynurenine formamidase [Paenibacillus konkukensis]
MEQIRSCLELLAGMRLIDLSHTLEEEMPVYPTHSRYFHTKWDSFDTGSPALVGQLLINEHCGTHVDATGHFLQEGHPEHRYMAETPLSNCMGRAVTLDFAHYTDQDLVSIDELREWEQANGPIEPGDIVLFRFGWDRHYAPRNVDRSYTASWPGISGEAAEYLVSRKIKAVGCDTLAIDGSGSSGNPAHYSLLGSGINIFENLKGLDRTLGESFFIGLPLKIKGGSGSPVRAVAFVPGRQVR